MRTIMITGTILMAVALVHFAYVDFRFRHRDGIKWFWLAGPAPPLLWTSRAAAAGVFLGALATAFVGPTKIMFLLLIGLMVVHIVTLVILEIRETR